MFCKQEFRELYVWQMGIKKPIRVRRMSVSFADSKLTAKIGNGNLTRSLPSTTFGGGGILGRNALKSKKRGRIWGKLPSG